MIWQYHSLFGKPEYWLDPNEFDAHLQKREISRLIDDVYPDLATAPKKSKEEAVLKAMGLRQREELADFVRMDRLYYRLAFRDITGDYNERTLVASLLPPQLGAQNTLWMSIPKRYRYDATQHTVNVEDTPLSRLFFVQALFNTLIVDWTLRFSVALHVNKTYLTRLPLPQPSDVELHNNPTYAELCRNSLLLSLYHNREGFNPLQREFGLADKDIPRTDKQADMLKIRNDILVAGLYGITKAEMEHMLKSFEVLARKKPGYIQALLGAM
jgi:hypothetical protein